MATPAEWAERRALRELLLSRSDLRAGSEDLLRALLLDLADLDEDDQAPGYIEESVGVPITVQTARALIRQTLAEIAAREERDVFAPPDTPLGQGQRASAALRRLGFELALACAPFVRRIARFSRLGRPD